MRQKILKILVESKDAYISGEALSEELSVSRTSVWKHIKKLREEGYEIESIPAKGYRLIEKSDILNQDELKLKLSKYDLFDEILYFDSIDSTNTYGKKIASTSNRSYLIVANEQTNGRGRLGRNWNSDKGTGIWMSMVIRPDISPVNASKLTQVIAVCVSEAMDKFGVTTKIKWPNDIIINDRKSCGILTEMVSELNMIDYIVVGIGINVNSKTFDEEIVDIATSLSIEAKMEISRIDLLEEIIVNFKNYYRMFEETENLDFLLDKLNEKSYLIDKEIKIINRDDIRYGIAREIDRDGQLIAEINDDRIKLSYGEVSIRKV